MTGDFTGDDGSSVGRISSGAAYVGHTKVNDARCSGYDIPRERSAVERATRQMLPKGQKLPVAASSDDDRERRSAVRQHLRRAKERATRFVEACRQGDVLELAVLGFALTDELDVLWANRSVREEEWAETLNFLQSAIAREEFERFTLAQCEAVQAVIVDHLCGGLVDPEDVTRVRLMSTELWTRSMESDFRHFWVKSPCPQAPPYSLTHPSRSHALSTARPSNGESASGFNSTV